MLTPPPGPHCNSEEMAEADDQEETMIDIEKSLDENPMSRVSEPFIPNECRRRAPGHYRVKNAEPVEWHRVTIGNLVPAKGDYPLFLHDYPQNIKSKDTDYGRQESMSVFHLIRLFAFLFSGAGFVRRQCPMIKNWNNISSEILEEWTDMAAGLFDGYTNDRLVFVHEGVGFCASAFHHTNGYEWERVSDGSVYDPNIDGDWHGKVRVLIPYDFKDNETVEDEEETEE